jgi:hypothetical protein
MEALTDREMGRTDTILGFALKEFLHHPVFQRMVGDDRQPSAGRHNMGDGFQE